MNTHVKLATVAQDRHFTRRMAGARRPRRHLPADRPLRLGRRHLQSFLDARARRGAQIPDQAARTPLRGSDAIEPRQGEHGRRSRRIRRRQPAGLHAARRRAFGPAGRQLRRPRPHRDRHGDLRTKARSAHAVAAGGALLQSRRLSRLRRHHRGFRRARAHQQGAGQEPRADHAQSRAAHGRQDRARGVRADEVADRGRRNPAQDGSDRRRADRNPGRDLRENRASIRASRIPAAARPIGRPTCACSTPSMRSGGIDRVVQ